MENTELTIFEQFEKMHLKVSIRENAPKSDLEFMRLLQEGKEEDNINKIYQFIEACERGCGLLRDESIFHMISDAYAENSKKLMTILVQKTFFEQCILLSICKQYMIDEFIMLGAADNMRFLYECLRKTLVNSSKENEKVLIQGITVLSTQSDELWKYWIKKHEYNKKWQRLLNKVLLSINKDALLVYVDTIDINMDIINGQEIYRAINEIPVEKMKSIQKIISEALCKRWKCYLEQIRTAKPYHDNMKKSAYEGLLLSAIRYYECRIQTDWEKNVVANIDILLTHMNQWHKSYTEFKSIFWIDYTQIMYLMNIGVECGYSQEKVQGKIQKLQLYIERNRYLLENFI